MDLNLIHQTTSILLFDLTNLDMNLDKLSKLKDERNRIERVGQEVGQVVQDANYLSRNGGNRNDNLEDAKSQPTKKYTLKKRTSHR